MHIVGAKPCFILHNSYSVVIPGNTASFIREKFQFYR